MILAYQVILAELRFDVLCSFCIGQAELRQAYFFSRICVIDIASLIIYGTSIRRPL